MNSELKSDEVFTSEFTLLFVALLYMVLKIQCNTFSVLNIQVPF